MGDKKSKQNRTQLLKRVPMGAERIYVMNELGKLKYKRIEELADKDVIQCKKNGSPIVMMIKPGRSEVMTKVGPANSVVAKLQERKGEALDKDTLLALAKARPESTDVLQEVMVGLADEAASISFERQEAERKGEATSSLSMRRVTALKAVGDTWLKRKEQIVSRGVDMDSPGFEAVFGFILETVRGSLLDVGVDKNSIRVGFNMVGEKIATDEWKAEAKNRMTNNG